MSKVKTQAEQMTYDEYKRFSSLLEGIESFVKKHPILTYIEFDYYVVHDMTLFSIEPDFDFGHLDEMIKHMRKTMPAVKRIFNKPIIVLKDTDDVLPVENTRIINQNTLLHLANHSQNVANLTERGVKPRKLLTRIYEDDYSIYENVIFCWVMHEQGIIDHILENTARPNCNVRSVSLLCNEQTLRERLSEDIRNGIRKEDVILRSVARIPLYDKLDTVKIVTDGKTPENVADEIAAL
ncbi:hypothetical protein EOM86_13155 [Candidatus Nomurabacteria bacterium]|nr:hypothetical protein [Candidatus Nomurabacteria bacterium]